MSKVGIFGVRLDHSGLAYQTFNLTRMLRPDKILAVDSSTFNKDMQQDYDRFEGFSGIMAKAWPTNRECVAFLNTGVTHIFCAETPYNMALYGYANTRGAKVFTQPNPEFFDGWNHPHEPKPTKYLMPSYWYLDEMIERYGADMVQYLPPPAFPSDFKNARDENFRRAGRRKFLHIMGRTVSKDRNGTFSLLDSLKHTKADFELTIRCQHDCEEYINYSDDKRITWDIRNIPIQEDMYKDFDAMIMPRRYGGLCLPANEALMSGLPVIMPDISPNNRLLPPEWLVTANITDTLQTRILLDVYSADSHLLAEKLDWLTTMPDKTLQAMKLQAFELGYDNFSPEVLKPKYEELLT